MKCFQEENFKLALYWFSLCAYADPNNTEWESMRSKAETIVGESKMDESRRKAQQEALARSQSISRLQLLNGSTPSAAAKNKEANTLCRACS